VRRALSSPTPTPVTAGQLLTAEQLAVKWQVPKSHVYRLAREGALPVVKLGRYYRFKAEAVERFENEGGLAA
jgi:excisionase family DNA binding protein